MKRYIATGAAGAALLGIALAWSFFGGDGQRPPAPPAKPDPRLEVAAPPPLPGPRTGAPAAAAKPGAPSFDVVRINPNGDAVIAGRAAPGAEVTILDGGRELGKAVADARGEWVFVPAGRLPPGSRELSLRARNPDGTEQSSASVVVLHVPEAGTPALAEAKPGDAKPGDAKPGDAKPGETAVAVVTPREGGPSRVLQTPPPAPEKKSSSPVSVDAVDYDAEGQLILSGRGAPGGEIVVYLNDKPIGRAKPDADGNWRLHVGRKIEPGDYRLRADQVTGEPGQPAKVAARVEMPFTQIDVLKHLQASVPGADTVYVIVQPGDSLWRISRYHLGRGIQYTVIYQANKDQIRDPDLIYPGQVFAVPTTN
ncbi:MAG: LysM peptidoglycan-binding domain-containing protein [Rhodospirillales bacterium]